MPNDLVLVEALAAQQLPASVLVQLGVLPVLIQLHSHFVTVKMHAVDVVTPPQTSNCPANTTDPELFDCGHRPSQKRDVCFGAALECFIPSSLR